MVFFFNDTATTEIYTLSLHDALPIWEGLGEPTRQPELLPSLGVGTSSATHPPVVPDEDHRLLDTHTLPAQLDVLLRERSEEHTSELQSRQYLVCRLLLEKKNNIDIKD